MRAAFVSVGFALLAGLSIAGGWVAVSAAASEAQSGSVAIVASGAAAATATRADGSTRVELPWLLPGRHGRRRLARRPPARVLERTQRQQRDLRRRHAKRQCAQPHRQPASRRRRARVVARRTADRLVEREGGIARPLRDERRRQRQAPGGRATPRTTSSRPGRRTEPRSRTPRTEAGATSCGRSTWPEAEPTLIVESCRPDARAGLEPVGTKIAFTGSTAGNADVWVAGIDGSPPRPVDDLAGIRRPARLVTRRPSHRVREHARRLAADLAHARRRQPAAVARDAPRTGMTRPHWGLRRARRSALIPRLLLPDLDQQAPSGILVMRVGREDPARVHLGGRQCRGRPDPHPGDAPRQSADDAGRPAHPRPGRHDQRRASMSGGSPTSRIHRTRHWHLSPYQAYELHSISDDDGRCAATGKSGFCLLDRWGHAIRRPGIVPGPPRFVGDCAARQPDARRVDEGSSVGYTDRYPGFFHGQDIDITGLDPGLYVLVHRANPERPSASFATRTTPRRS